MNFYKKRTGLLDDDRTGYLGGNAGVLLKCVSNVNIQTLTGANSITWNTQSLIDGLNITTNSQANIKSISFADRYNGLVAGSYTITNASAYPYVRLLHDEADLFSTDFAFDRLGRMVVSQNTKQFNKSPISFSYTTYDNLGRITEVGEKAENTDGHKFKNIFGTVVNTFFNPRVINDDSLKTWIADNTGSRTEVTHTYYDTIQYPGIPVVQQNLRKRVASTTFEDKDDNNRLTFNYATHFSYDIHGNVKTLIQDNPDLYTVTSTNKQQYKRMDYDYDLVSGKVNQVSYQSGKPDRFYHKYTYDADNRITQVWTSKDSLMWDNDAKYFYYAHGPLSRTEIGDVCGGLQIQGMDYAYTLQGWIKAVNSNLLKANTDMGHDGLASTINAGFAHDAFGYSLNYFNGDYKPIGTIATTDTAVATLAGSDVLKGRHDLFNGNISSMATSITAPVTYTKTTGTATPLPQATAYKYDQLNRLVEMQAYQNINTSTNAWSGGSTYAGLYNNKFIYDANGNILTQLRKDSASKTLDSLTYHYAKQMGRTIQNRLYNVNDAVASGYSTTDIDDEGTYDSTLTNINSVNNYRYDEIGNLKHDSQEQIDTIKWSVYGKIKLVARTSGSTRKRLKFDYDPSGNRIAKKVYNAHGDTLLSTDYYVRDALGNIMAIYKKQNIGATASFMLKERNIYGSAMLGTDYKNREMIGDTILPSLDTLNRYLGFKHFNLTNHLSNVLAVVSDKKIPRYVSGVQDHYEPEILSANDYTAFGAPMSGRTFNSSASRYGFNGKEKDDEINSSSGTSYDFGARMYNPRLGRWLACDPQAIKYPDLSPFSFVANNPIIAIDPNGETIEVVERKGFLGIGRKTVEYTPGTGYTGKSQYAKEVFASFDYNISIGKGANIIKIANDKKVTLTVKNQGLHKTPYFVGRKDNTGVLKYNPRSGFENEDDNGNPTGEFIAPSRLAKHEIDHAEDYFYDRANFETRFNTPDPLFDNEEEKKVIDQENKDKLPEEPTRTNHFGREKLYETPLPNNSPIDGGSNVPNAIPNHEEGHQQEEKREGKKE